MGLHINSLEYIPTSANRSYFVYLLDYRWYEPLGEAMTANYEKMAAIAAENDAVVIKGIDELFMSQHNFNGEDAEELLPSILIAKMDLSDFRISRELKKGVGQALVDSIILEPNFSGIGFSINKLISYLNSK